MRGLSPSEVAERVARGLTNATKQTTSRPLWHIIRDNVFTLFNAILTVCFAAVLLFGDLRDGLFYGIVVANSLIGIVQEVRAKLALDRLALLATPIVAVRRDGETVTMDPAHLVLDDVVVLRAGDQIVADAQVLESTDLTINESLLTGESEPIVKRAGDTVLSGALVAGGTGHVQVTAVGADSYANRLTAQIRRHSLAHSELRAATNRILVYISWVLGPIVLAVIGSRMLTYGDGFDIAALGDGRWRPALLDVVASVVGMIPEGLVLLISLAFGVAAIRLARQRVLIQELAAVEILARVDVLCLDKTGTLTTGDVSFRRYELFADDPHFLSALALFAHDDAANATARSLAQQFPPTGATALRRVPFSSARAFSAVALEIEGGRSSWLLGAPEELLASVDRASAVAHAGEGTRTLALVRLDGDLPASEEIVLGDLSLRPIALLLFGETIRPDAGATLNYFAEQSVRCVIISGDNPATVAALARGLGVGDTSVDARTLVDDDQLRRALAEHSIFGRVTSDQKRAIVRVLQKDGRTVAMTGDGVNDAMAIKDADLGIAMGSGTAASKAVARVVLLDDEFGRLPNVLLYGRQVIANVERVANLFLAKTTYGVIFAIVFAALLWEFPFLPRQLTLVSTLTIGIPAFFLALAPNRRIYHPGILGRLLRYAVPTGSIAAITTFTTNAIVRQLVSQDEARSITTLALWIVAFWILNVLSRPLDRWRVALLASVLAAFILANTAPIGRDFFAMHLEPTPVLLIGLVAGCIGAAGIELMYRFARSRGLIYDRE
ncbi:MAG: HAD-IC family P-type ATPase [Rhodoglobus sp.]